MGAEVVDDIVTTERGLIQLSDDGDELDALAPVFYPVGTVGNIVGITGIKVQLELLHVCHVCVVARRKM